MIKSFQNHPISLITRFVRCFSLQKAMFEFSCYVGGEDRKTLKRRILKIRGEQINIHWLRTILLSLEKDEELAFHSRLVKNGKYYYFPQIDFWGTEFLSVLDELQIDLEILHLYKSGKSFHGYYNRILSEKEWKEFLGKLLLFSPCSIERKPYIDYRWIGHSLVNGYSALRWSNNSSKYRAYPLLVDLRRQSLCK